MGAKLDLILGSALWGWTVPRERCFELLDSFYAAGYRQVDCATNYPIDKDPAHFRLAEDILVEWVNTHHVNDLRVIMKVGSIDNSGSPANNLHNSFLLMSYDFYRTKLGENLDTIMVHWDNREDPSAIEWSVRALEAIRKNGTRPGLSGISSPDLYAKFIGDAADQYLIQCKHNIFQSAYSHYTPFRDRSRFIVYGINAGGLKLGARYAEASSASVRGVDIARYGKVLAALEGIAEKLAVASGVGVASFNHIAMLDVWQTAGLDGVIIGTSRKSQLEESIAYARWLSENETGSLAAELHAALQKAGVDTGMGQAK